MLIDKKSKMVFNNRKECRGILGNKRYNELVKNKRLYFLDNNNPLLTLDEQIDYIKRVY